MNNRVITTVAAIAAAGSLLAGCLPSDRPTAEPSSSAQTSAATAAALTYDNPVVRAKEAGEEMPMTAIFGTLTNPTEADITLRGFSTSLGDARYEIHKTENGVMSPVDGGLVIPAGESVELAPGGFHLMILDFPSEIAAGETVDLTLDTDAGDIDVPGVQVRSMIPGHESYGDMAGHADHADHMNH